MKDQDRSRATSITSAALQSSKASSNCSTARLTAHIPVPSQRHTGATALATALNEKKTQDKKKSTVERSASERKRGKISRRDIAHTKAEDSPSELPTNDT